MEEKQSSFLPKKSIKTSLLKNFILVALLPTLAISLGSIIFGYFNARQNTVNQLESMAALEENKINTWIESFQNELALTLNETYLLERIQVTLGYEHKDVYYVYYINGARFRMNRYLEERRLLETISVLDLNGNVVLSTDENQEGKNYINELFFHKGLEYAITLLVINPDLGPGYNIVSAQPIKDNDGLVIGELVGLVPPESLSSLLTINGLADQETRIFLVDEENNFFAAPDTLLSAQSLEAETVSANSSGIMQALETKEHGFLSYTNDQGQRVYGVHLWVPALSTALIVEQNLSTVLSNIITNQIINFFIILSGSILAVFISINTSKRIARPLESLSNASVKIASGDFSHTVDLETEDEVGILAKTFNSMASQIRELVENLETNVKNRTGELQETNKQLLKRARQMETISLVSREITSILNLNDLLSRVVLLIKESFDYQKVSIYLLDMNSRQLIQRADSITSGIQNRVLFLDYESLERSGLQDNQVLSTHDFPQFCSELSNPDLPDTQMEFMIPLRISGQVIGTMNIQPGDPQIFAQEDQSVLQGLGDQIAIAIHNTMMVEKNQELAVLEERNRMARELHDSILQLLYSQIMYAEASLTTVLNGKSEKSLEYINRLQESATQAVKEMRLMIYELRPAILEEEGLWGAIKQRIEMVEQRSGIIVNLYENPHLTLPISVEKELYLIAQEALNNILKHSFAKSVDISLKKEKDFLIFAILDDGAGFEKASAKTGHGLKNIEEHAQNAGGTAEIESASGRGTKILIRIPGGNESE